MVALARLGLALAALATLATRATSTSTSTQSFRVVVNATGAGAGPVTGRVRLYFSRVCGASDPPPRSQCDDSQATSQVFGVDAVSLDVGDAVAINATVLGYPALGLGDLPAGEYCVQAELFPYETYHRGDGVTVVLPSSCIGPGNDGAYGSPPGTLYSDVLRHFAFNPAGRPTVHPVALVHAVPPTPPAKETGCSGTGTDTDYIKTLTVPSPLLSAFWGKPVSLTACVLLPWGFAEHESARYPLVVAHGHYSSVFDPGGRFSETPPSESLPGYEYVDQQYAYWLYKNWTHPGKDSPFYKARALVITVKHPVPFFDDSYAVDSPNVGPYGTAILKELIPAVETRYRGIGKGWARGVLGGSTGGWEAMASQVLYPDEFNYAAVACPDPISFESYATVNLHEPGNAYWYTSQFKQTARPGTRDHYSGQTVVPGTRTPTYVVPRGDTTATVEEMNRREIVLGTHSRSCGQWDIWEAVFGPRGEDGYPARVWCKDPRDPSCKYGEINTTVAAYWIEHFDLLSIMKRDWASGLGTKLSGKLHVFVGGSDTFFLTNAVMDLQDWVEQSLLDPPFNGTITIGAHNGRGFEHCFNGFLPDGTVAPNSVTRELYITKFLPRMAERWAATAPAGANMEWHTY